MAIIRKLEPKHDHVEPPKEVRPKRFSKEHDDSNWLISYADLMTLLCMFYIMLFSMSKLNTPEFEKVKKQVAEHFGTKYQSPTEDLGKVIQKSLVEAGVDSNLAQVTSDGVSVNIAFQSTLFFESLSAEISEPGKQVILKIANAIQGQQQKAGKKYKFVVEGHTDSQPVIGGPYPSNWELSSARAARVVRLFMENGYGAEYLLPLGFADTQPVVESRNPDGTWSEAGLAKNRRVVLRVLMPEVDAIPWKVGPVKPNTSVSAAKPQAQPVAAQAVVNQAKPPVQTAPVQAATSQAVAQQPQSVQPASVPTKAQAAGSVPQSTINGERK